MDTPQGMLILPAIRGHIGDWIYYTTVMKMSDIAGRVSDADEVHPSITLNQMIQRELTSRADKICDYLLTQDQRFFNALVIGVYGGAPDWYEVSVKGNEYLNDDDIPASIEGMIGLLSLRRETELFAIDGQHRVAGIRTALSGSGGHDTSRLGLEEVSCIFVAHRKTEEGRKRTRRLFSTLNRHAKPVSKAEIIALDENDVIAVLTRWHIDEHPLFQNRVAAKKEKGVYKSKSMSVTDQSNFTNILTVYDALDIYLRDVPTVRWNRFKQYWPGEDALHDYRDSAVLLWKALVEAFVPLSRAIR